jgi:hypothetical protein
VKTPERKDLTWRDRLVFGLAGLFIILYGYGQEMRGKWIYTNWRGLDVTARFVMAIGTLCVAAAVFPWWGRIHFLWDTDKKNRRK